MKKILYIIALVTTSFMMSCNGFLKTSSGDLIIPKDVNHFMDLLNGEGYPSDFTSSANWIKFMTDDVMMAPTKNKNTYLSEMSDEILWPYRWDFNIEEKQVDQLWSTAYQRILGCNLVISDLQNITYDEETEKDLFYLLKAQAYALRAYHYFCLVNWYGQPWYVGETKQQYFAKDGVIIKTSPDVTLETLERSTVGEVWALINIDIEKAMEALPYARVKINKFSLNAGAIMFLQNRIALFQQNWDLVIDKGERFLIDYPSILDLKSQDVSKFGIMEKPFSIMSIENPEILFTFSKITTSSDPYGNITWSRIFSHGQMPSKGFQGALIDKYLDNDLRKDAYFRKDYKYDDIDENWNPIEIHVYNCNYPLKYYSLNQNKCYMENWRTVEVVLNVAEAYAQRDGVSVKAIEMLNRLRSNRFNGTYKALTTSDFSSKEELIEFVWEERRRELCFEETMRFWDMRRQGCKQVTHKVYNDGNVIDTYVLKEKSPNFTIQIPKSELNFNTNIKANPREVITKNV